MVIYDYMFPVSFFGSHMEKGEQTLTSVWNNYTVAIILLMATVCDSGHRIVDYLPCKLKIYREIDSDSIYSLKHIYLYITHITTLLKYCAYYKIYKYYNIGIDIK